MNNVHKSKLILIFFFIALNLLAKEALSKSKMAITIVPVADLVCAALPNNDKDETNRFQSYSTLPLESKKGSYLCKRLNQALFNEIIEIIDDLDDQVQVKTLNTFYQNKESKNESKYWAKKENFVYLDDLYKAGINKKFIPEPINYESKDNKHIEKVNKNVVTLKLPFFDKITGKNFSAGTRFVKTGNASQNAFEVFVLDAGKYNPKKSGSSAKNYKIAKIMIPKEICAKNIICKKSSKNCEEKRIEFLSILKNWANLANNSFIPYVWGGSSFVYKCTDPIIIQDSQLPVYTRPGFPHCPATGFDCSGLVARAAQICNIPYFYKNTLTAKNNLKSINNYKDLQNGDLIIYTGHIIVVSNVNKNKMIEARTNEYGLGQVHETTLGKIFKNVKTYKDLFQLRDSNGIIERIDVIGPELERVNSIGFYTLPT